MNDYPYISQIKSPEDVKGLPPEALSPLCEELRRFLVEKVTARGGHLASNLGAVELTVALHRVFSSPEDHVIFDVGHQSYVHKILTGRADRFDALRTPGGLSGFPRRAESAHDPFGTGHSSTSVSAALGFAEADALQKKDAYTVAVVGDGAFTGGMIHEALNNCRRDLRLVIVLNDNEMSISKNIGLFARYLSRIRISRKYRATKTRTRNFLSHIPLLGKGMTALLSKTKSAIKRRVYRDNYFEELGLIYLGPVDGHDVRALEKAFAEAKARECAVVVHVRTVKGKGYAVAENNPTAFHGVPSAPAENVQEGSPDTFHSVASQMLCALARRDEAICAVTAAMGEGTGLSAFGEKYPERYFDVGIAEEHALTFSAGLCAAGMKPYFAVYSTFLQRAYDNLLHDVALQGLPVRILVDRAGLAQADGATHHGIFDVAFASHIPNVRILAPACYGSLCAMLISSQNVNNCLLIRYPNSAEDERVHALFYPEEDFTEYGVRAVGLEGAEAVLIAYGNAVSAALDAMLLLGKSGVRVGMILLETLAPYAETAERVLPLLPAGAPVVFVEEGIREGGAGMLLEAALRLQIKSPSELSYTTLAIDGHFAEGEAGVPLPASCGIDAKAVASAVARALLAKETHGGRENREQNV